MGSDLTPLQAVRLKCLDCADGSRGEVKECAVQGCELWPYRFGRQPEEGVKAASTAARAIKAKCVACNGPDFSGCGKEFEWCPLLQYITARKKKKRNISPEERERRAERMRALREKQLTQAD